METLLGLVGKNRSFLLAMAAGYVFLAGVHASVFVEPSGLYAAQSLPQEQPWPTTMQALGLLYLFALLYLRYRCPAPEAVGSRTLLAAAAGLGVLAWLSPPANSGDIFAYVGFGRLEAVYHLSPYEHTYRGIKDAFVPYAWNKDVMIYGPVSLVPFYVAGLLSQGSLLAALYWLKAVSLGLHVLTVLVLTHTVAPHRRQHLLLYAANPLLLFELVTDGHIESWFLVFLCLCVFCVRRQHDLGAVAFALASALSKPQGFFILGSLFIYLLLRHRWRPLALGGGLVVVVLVLLRLTLYTSDAGLWVLSPWVHASYGLHVPNNLPGWLGTPGKAWAGWTESMNHFFWYGVQALAGVWALGWLGRARTPSRLWAAQFFTLALLLTVGTFYYQPWYQTWLLPLSLLLPGSFFRYALFSSFTSLFSVYYIDSQYVLLLCVAVSMWLYGEGLRASPGSLLRRVLQVLLVVSAGAAVLAGSEWVSPGFLRVAVGQLLPLLAWLAAVVAAERRRTN